MSSGRTVSQEAARYLGYGIAEPDAKTAGLIKECLEELQTLTAARKFIYRCYPLSVYNDEIVIGSLEVISKDLAANLKGCKEAAIFAATLGVGVDRALYRYECVNMAKAVVMQACGAAVLEDYCDQVQEEIRKKYEGRFLRPRFSPGYGDFGIWSQKALLDALDAPKQIGLMMTEASMLTPMKSVTAVIGIGDTCVKGIKSGCLSCTKADCSYRREMRGEERC